MRSNVHSRSNQRNESAQITLNKAGVSQKQPNAPGSNVINKHKGKK